MLSKGVKRFLWMIKSPRTIMSVVTLLFLALILFLSRHELVKAWELLHRANVWLLLLLIPFQVIVYFAGGEMVFSYLRQKKLIRHISRFEQTRIALELNLVNHIFPSGGVSGISYVTWRMSKLNVDSARSTFAQVVRYVTGFLALLALLILAVVILAIDGQVNRYIVGASFLLVIVILGLTFGLIFMFSSQRRILLVAEKLARLINTFIKVTTFGKNRRLVSSTKVKSFFENMHDDFSELADNPKLLIKPFIWGIIYTVFDVLMFMVVFLSLGVLVNPAILMVGYGVAGLAGLVVFTPGGAGVYEAIMIIFLSMAGTSSDLAIAGIILTRAILVTGTITLGYIFYQHAIIKYGKPNDTKIQR